MGCTAGRVMLLLLLLVLLLQGDPDRCRRRLLRLLLLEDLLCRGGWSPELRWAQSRGPRVGNGADALEVRGGKTNGFEATGRRRRRWR